MIRGLRVGLLTLALAWLVAPPPASGHASWPRLPSEADLEQATRRLFDENRMEGEGISYVRFHDPHESDPLRSAGVLLLVSVIDRPSAPYIPPDPPKYLVFGLSGYTDQGFDYGAGAKSFNSEAERSAWIQRLYEPSPPAIPGYQRSWQSTWGSRPAPPLAPGWPGSAAPADRVRIQLSASEVRQGRLYVQGTIQSPTPITSLLFMRTQGGRLAQGQIRLDGGRLLAECEVSPGETNLFEISADQQQGPGGQVTLRVEGSRVTSAGLTEQGEVLPPPPPLPEGGGSPGVSEGRVQPGDLDEPIEPGDLDGVEPLDEPAPPQPEGGEDGAPPVDGPAGGEAPGLQGPVPGLEGVGAVPGPGSLTQAVLAGVLPALLAGLLAGAGALPGLLAGGGSLVPGSVDPAGAGAEPPASSEPDKAHPDKPAEPRDPDKESPDKQDNPAERQEAEQHAARMAALQSRVQEILRQKTAEGYYIANASMAGKVWNNFPVLSSTRDWLGGWTWGQCGEADNWGRQWLEQPLREVFGDRAETASITIKNACAPNLINHISTRVFLPDGRRLVVCFWEGLSQGRPAIMTEKEWEHLWTLKCSGVQAMGELGRELAQAGQPGPPSGEAPQAHLERQRRWEEHLRRLGIPDDGRPAPTLDPMVIERSADEDALKNYILQAGGDERQGIQRFLGQRGLGEPGTPGYEQKLAHRRLLVKSWQREPW